MAKAKIYNSKNKCMTGSELRRLRKKACLSQEQLADKLKEWGWYRAKIVMFEQSDEFCLVPTEMQALLAALEDELKRYVETTSPQIKSAMSKRVKKLSA